MWEEAVALACKLWSSKASDLIQINEARLRHRREAVQIKKNPTRQGREFWGVRAAPGLGQQLESHNTRCPASQRRDLNQKFDFT